MDKKPLFEKLMQAVEKDDATGVAAALTAGAKADMDGGAPLLGAALRQNKEIAALLVAARAPINQAEDLAAAQQESYSGMDPATVDDDRQYRAYLTAGKWLRENKVDILVQALGVLDAALNPKALDKQKISAPKTGFTP